MLESNKILVFKPQTRLNTYTVKYVFSKGTQKPTTLSFEIKVAYIKQNLKGFLFEISKNPNYFVNDKEVSSFGEELALKSIDCLYPLQIYTDKTLKWNTIVNQDTIIKRWEKHKNTLQEYYQGEWCDEYLQEMEKTLTSKRLLRGALEQDLFLNTFFNGIYTDYSNELEIPKEDFIPFIPHCNPVAFVGKISISKYLDEFDNRSVTFEATLNDSRSKTDFENQNDFRCYEDDTVIKGNVYAKYVLDINNNIEGIYKLCNLELSKEQRIEIIITKE